MTAQRKRVQVPQWRFRSLHDALPVEVELELLEEDATPYVGKTALYAVYRADELIGYCESFRDATHHYNRSGRLITRTTYRKSWRAGNERFLTRHNSAFGYTRAEALRYLVERSGGWPKGTDQ